MRLFWWYFKHSGNHLQQIQGLTYETWGTQQLVSFFALCQNCWGVCFLLYFHSVKTVKVNASAVFTDSNFLSTGCPNMFTIVFAFSVVNPRKVAFIHDFLTLEIMHISWRPRRLRRVAPFTRQFARRFAKH